MLEMLKCWLYFCEILSSRSHLNFLFYIPSLTGLQAYFCVYLKSLLSPFGNFYERLPYSDE